MRTSVFPARVRIAGASSRCRTRRKGKGQGELRNRKTKVGLKSSEVIPDDVMGGTATIVSRDALVEADAMPARKEPVNWSRRIFRLVLLGCLLGVLFWSGLGIYHWWLGRSESQAVQFVQAAVNKKELPPESRAILHEFLMLRYVRAGQATGERIDDTGFFERIGFWSSKKKGPKTETTPDSADRQFKLALGLLSGDQTDSEDRDFVLVDLALNQIDLAGSKEEAEAGRRLKWDDAQKSVGAALKAIHSREVKLEGIRQVMRRLLARKESKRVDALTNQVFTDEAEKADARARVALELFQAGETELVKTIGDQVLAPYTRDKSAPAEKGPPGPDGKERASARRQPRTSPGREDSSSDLRCDCPGRGAGPAIAPGRRGRSVPGDQTAGAG